MCAFKFEVSHYMKCINGESHNVTNIDLGDVSMDDLYTYYDDFNVTKGEVNNKIVSFATFESDNQTDVSNLHKRKDVNLCWKEVVKGACREFSRSAVAQVGEFLTTKLIHLEDYQICKEVQYYTMTANGETVLHIGVESTTVSGAGDCSTTAEFDTVLGAIDKFLNKHKNICKTWCMKLTHGGNWIGYVKIGISDDTWDGFGCNVQQNYGGCILGGKHDEL